MTRTRISAARELYGILAPSSRGVAPVLRSWNAWFERMSMDACLSLYPTRSDQVPERLSDMFHFDRRAYLVHVSLRPDIIPFLDHWQGGGDPDVILNVHGCFVGHALSWTERHPDQLWHELQRLSETQEFTPASIRGSRQRAVTAVKSAHDVSHS